MSVGFEYRVDSVVAELASIGIEAPKELREALEINAWRINDYDDVRDAAQDLRTAKTKAEWQRAEAALIAARSRHYFYESQEVQEVIRAEVVQRQHTALIGVAPGVYEDLAVVFSDPAEIFTKAWQDLPNLADDPDTIDFSETEYAALVECGKQKGRMDRVKSAYDALSTALGITSTYDQYTDIAARFGEFDDPEQAWATGANIENTKKGYAYTKPYARIAPWTWILANGGTLSLVSPQEAVRRMDRAEREEGQEND